MKSSQSTAQVEGAYRLIRNPSVSPQAIAEAGFTATVRACEAHPLLLALEDTTTINFSHSTASDNLGNTTTNPKADAKRRAGSPPGPDVHQLQRSQHKKSRQQRPGAPAHVCLLPGAGRGRCLLASADVRKSGECVNATMFDRYRLISLALTLTPTLKWACLKLAKLGRWHDSKRTGRPGWVVMWDGWFRLQDMVEGYLVMKSLDQEI